MKIEIKCARCGSNNFELADALTDNSAVSCADCGHDIGTMGELKAKLAELVVRRSRVARAREESRTS